MAQRTASTTLRNSTIAPSPVRRNWPLRAEALGRHFGSVQPLLLGKPLFHRGGGARKGSDWVGRPIGVKLHGKDVLRWRFPSFSARFDLFRRRVVASGPFLACSHCVQCILHAML